jgi:hypothetical protein
MGVHLRQSADDAGLGGEKIRRIRGARLLLQGLAASPQEQDRHGHSNYRFIEKHPFHYCKDLKG